MATMLQVQPLEEFAQEPLLTVASVLLIVVSIGWILVSRMISRNLRKSATRARDKKRGAVRPAKDIWAGPPDR
jgi:cell division protein FtsX